MRQGIMGVLSSWEMVSEAQGYLGGFASAGGRTAEGSVPYSLLKMSVGLPSSGILIFPSGSGLSKKDRPEHNVTATLPV